MRRTALVLAVVLAVGLGGPTASMARPGQDPLPLSWLWSWWSLPAGWASPGGASGPAQESAGTAASKSHAASAASTRANRGAGKAAGKGVGELDPYSPHRPDRPGAVTTAKNPDDRSFDPVKSKRVAKDSTVDSDVFQNPDGSFTRKVYPGPHNFKSSDGSWTPIDTKVSKGSDGRWHEGANAFGVDFAGTGDDAALVSISMDASHSIGYGLANAASVTPSTSGATATYAGILPNTDLSLTTTATGTDESLILHNASAGSSWVFPLRLQGVAPRLESDGSVSFVDSADVVRGSVPPASMTDTKGATSTKVSYQLTTVGGAPALAMSADSGWLHAAARVFPVVVDPPVNLTSSSATFADSVIGGNNSGSSLLYMGAKNGTETARSFLQFPNFAATYSGATITGVSLNLFAVYAPTCATEAFNVSRINQAWTPSGVTAWPGPTFDSTPLVPYQTSLTTACTNTARNLSLGDQLSVSLPIATFTSWASGGDNFGLALSAASETDANAWKEFASDNTANAPYLSVTYSGNLHPVIDSQSPANNATVWTLQPELLVEAHDPDNSAALWYSFYLYDSGNTSTPLVSQTSTHAYAWQVPSGYLTVGKTYLWFVSVGDGTSSVNGQVYGFRVEAKQPPITSHLSQNSANNGLDPSIGNYTTTTTDATALTAGPPLQLQRYYNSKDPYMHALGVGWSSVLDSRALEVTDPQSGLFSVIVTYPDGQQVGFGRKSDGSFTAPLGRYATLKSVPGGYTLTDKNQTVYTFGQYNGSNSYGLTSITDPNNRSIAIGYTTYLGSPRIASITSSVSGRVLHVGWGASGLIPVRNGAAVSPILVTSISTDDAVAGDNTTAQTWTYSYNAANLAMVCPPTSVTACTHYTYQSASTYPNTLLDLGPRSYWRLGEPAGATVANSQVLANDGADAGTYHNVTLGVAGALNGSTATAGSFDGSSSWVDLTQGGNPGRPIIDVGQYQSVSMWFKTSTAGGVLFSYQANAVSNATTSGYYTPALYVGTDGKLRGEFYQGSYTPITTTNAVTDNQWHHVVLSGAGNTQSMYLDGVSVGTLSGTIGFTFPTGRQYAYVGAGFQGFQWPSQPHYSTTNGTGYPSMFNGSISDVGFFNAALDGGSVSAMYNAGNAAGQMMSTITKPSGNLAASLTYDTVTGRVATLTDANGGTWTMNTPGVAGSSQVYANGVLGASPQAYYRLNDTTGPTAKDQVKGGDATYSNTSLNQASPFADGTGAASFPGSSAQSYVSLPNNLINGNTSMSTSMWFKTTIVGSVLLSYTQNPVTAGTNSAGYQPVLYIGNSGKLHAEFWVTTGATPIVTATSVADGNWHYAVLSYDSTGGGSQTLYLDGNKIGSISGAASAAGFLYDYVGAGFLGGGWPDQLNGNGPGVASYYIGNISDVAYYRNAISQQTVTAQYQASKTANTLITDGGAAPVETVNVTDPGGKTIAYAYDPNMGNRLLSRTDGLGSTTRYGYDANGFLNTTTDPNGAVTTTGHDVRGNMVSNTTCQNQATNSCSTTYYTYYPDDTNAAPTPDPRNDLVLTVNDPRSTSPSDTTYRTTFTYDTHGNRIGVTTPPVSGFPSGRITATAYADGTVTYPATGGGNVPAGLPVKVTTPGGAVTKTAYYSNGDTATVTDPVGLATSYTYDLLGRPLTKKVVSDSYPAGLATTLTFDNLNRQVSQTEPAVTNRVTGAVHTRKTTSTYDVDGNQTSVNVVDLTGGDASRTSSATFNNHDQQISATDAANNTTTFGYDAYGNKTTVTNPAGNETDSAYDANGRLLTTTLKAWTGDPANPSAATDLVKESRAYDPAGRLASTTDSMGWVTSYAYTDNGLTATVARTDPAHPGTSFIQESDSYDVAGHVVTQVTNNGATTTNMTVDAGDRTTTSTVDPSGVNRTTSYAYSPDDAVLSTRISSGPASTTTDATYDPAGQMTSQSIDNNVNTNSPSGWWKLNEATGTVASDSSSAQQTGTLSAGASWTPGGASSATFDGATGTITTNGPVLNTAADFSVSAWVNTTTLSGYPVAVSQDATHNAGFYLEYSSSLGKWAFAKTPDDTNTGGSLYAASNSAGTANTWVHLVGTYQLSNGKLTLYVNGAAQTTTGTDTTPFNATGPLTIGRAKYTSLNGQYWQGQIANVQIYPRVLSASDVSTLYGYGRAGGALATNRLTTTWTRDQRGLPTASTDPNGNTATYTYDEAGQLAITIAPTVSAETGGGTPTPTHPVVMTGYNTFGEKTEAVDANGNTTTTAYDAAGRATSVTLPSYTPPGGTPIAAVSHKTYNGLGQVLSSTDPLGQQTTYVYDQLGNLATATAPNLGVTHYTYDTDGDQLSVTDPNGAVNQATYDYLGRRVTATQVVRQPSTASYTTTYAYNSAGWRSSTTSPGNVVTSYAYDNVGETTTVTDAASNVTSNTYNYAGRVTKTTAPDGTASISAYDAAGRLLTASKTDTDGTTLLASTSTAYDNNGNATSSVDALGHTSTFTYDAMGYLTGEVQPISASASITTSFGYDAAGHRTRFTDGRANAFITTYNTWGLPESQIKPPTTAYPNLVDRTFTTAYDANGRVASQTSPGGVIVTNTYDTLNDLTGQSGSGADASTTARTFGYDTAGRMTSASAPSGTETFSLDDRGLLLSTSGPSGTSSFAYNGDGLMTGRTDASGTSTYTYDTADRLKAISDASTSAVLTLSYNALSQPTTVTYGASADTRTFGYDHLHRLTSDTLETSGGSTIASINYGYDTNGNETSKNTVGFTGASNNTYTYDWANRLLSWNNGTGTSNYAYDNSGNRTQSGTQTLSYNARNELTSGAGSTYNYTARGTLASVVTGSTTAYTTNDAFGQTITQGTQTYTYDALGRTITDTTSGGGTQTFTYSGVGNTPAGDGTSTYSRDPSGALVGAKTGATAVLAWTDLHTDVVAQFTTTGSSLAGSTTYGPLGTITATAGMTGNLGYQSAYTEFNTGRVNMAARWYNPATGQFDNRDTVSNSPTPNSVNADEYSYANDNPLTNTDPSGHCLGILCGFQKMIVAFVLGYASLKGPKAVHKAWKWLPSELKNTAIHSMSKSIGRLDGVPADARDEANRIVLNQSLADLAGKEAELKARLATLSKHPNSGNVMDPTRQEQMDLQKQLDAVSGLLNGANAIKNRIGDPTASDRGYLLMFDTDGNGHAIVATGNPDTADNIVTYVPGTTAKLADYDKEITRASRMANSASEADPERNTVGIVWLGYNAPQSILPEAADDHYAKDAEGDLRRFQDGLRATHQGARSHNTIIGHSYGSTVIGFTARDGGLDADDMIFVGSPGVGVDNVAGLHMGGDHVWSSHAKWDPIADLTKDPRDLATLSLLRSDPWLALRSYDADPRLYYGLNPDVPAFGGRTFTSDPGIPAYEGFGDGFGKAHSQYWDERSTSLQNMGHVIAGQYGGVH